MLVLALVCALGVAGDSPDDVADAVPAPVAAATPGAVRVAILPVQGASLTSEEAALLERLIAIRVERLGLLVVPAGGGGGDIELRTDHAKLGEADVVTFEADVVTGPTRGVFRDATSAKERGELADKMGPVVDSVLQRALASLPALTRPDVKKRLADAQLSVCEGNDTWWFCDALHHAVTENDFVRRYRAETNRHDLDVAELDRDPSYEPWMFLIAGGATALATVGATVAIGTTTQGQELVRNSDDAWVVLPVLGLSTALGLVVYGAIELDDTAQIHDGTELDHVLDENAARVALRSYNDALKLRIEREAGG